MPKTYEPIQTTSLPSGGTSVTFSSIPQTYTDLVLVVNSIIGSGEDAHGLQFNADTGSNYSATGLIGSGSAAASYRGSNAVKIDGGRVGTSWSTSIFNIMNYSNTTTFKSIVSRGNSTSSGSYVTLGAALWRNTSAITTIAVSVYNNQTMSSGSTFTLYGIKAA
jgi:hypothetical protein